MSVKYLNGLLSAKSDQILNEEELLRLASLPKGEFLKALSLKDFGPSFSHVEKIEDIINSETNKLNNLLIPFEKLNNLRIVIFYDSLLSSILSLYKHKIFNLKLNEVFNELVSNNELEEAILLNLVTRVNPFLKELIELINISIKKITKIDDLNNTIVKISYEYLIDYLDKSKEKELKDYLLYKIDLLNLNFASQNSDYEKITNKVLIERGDLYKVVIKSKDFNDLLNNQLAFYDAVLQQKILKLLKEGNLYLISDITNKFLLEKIRNYKYDLINQNHILYYSLVSLEQLKIFKEIYYGVYDGK